MKIPFLKRDKGVFASVGDDTGNEKGGKKRGQHSGPGLRM